MTTLILPGLGGSGLGHWQRWWLKQDRGARLVDQGNWDQPTLEAWQAILVAAIERHPGAILVAHSLSCALVAHVAGNRPDLRIGGALLVAPADVDDSDRIGAQLASFAPMPLGPLPFPSMVVGSSNDPFVSIGRAMMFAYAWGAKFVHLRDSGHINVASGFGAWPDGIRLAKRLGRSEEEPQSYLRLVQASAPGFV